MVIGWCAGLEAWPRLRDAGFDAVEVGAAATFGDDGLGLPPGVPVQSTNLFLPGGARLYGPDSRDWGPYVRRMIRRAAEAGVTMMVVGSGGARRAADGQTPADAEVAFADLVAGWQVDARAAGITLAPEPLNHRECDVMVLYSRLTQLMAERGGQVTLDSYHSLVERDPAQLDPSAYWTKELTQMPVHIHLSSADRLAPAPGDPWLEALARLMKSRSYNGRVMVEAALPETPEALRTTREALRVWE